jgi:DNA-binding LacI/PurR family transcriptional regulator
LRALEQLQSLGYNVVNIHPGQVEDIEPADIVAMKFAGVVMLYGLAASPKGQTLLRACRDAGIASVAYGDDPALEPFDRVCSDHEQGACQLVKWLHARGCRRIQRFWRMSHSPRWLDQRDLGYERACRELGIESLPAIRSPDLTAFYWATNQTSEDYQDLARTLLGFLYRPLSEKPGIDAIMVATDPHAYQVATVLRMLGKVPNRDVLIVGYDNCWRDIVERQWEPVGPAATVDKSNDRVAADMVALLHRRITGELPDAPHLHMLEPSVVVCDGQ